MRISNRARERVKRIPRGLFFILLVLSIGAVIALVNSAQVVQVGTIQGSSTHVVIRPIGAGDHVNGNPNAPVQIFVYSDPECPYCKYFELSIVPQLQHQYGNSIVFIYRHFLLPFRTKSPTETVALECAAELGGNNFFFKYLDALFTATPSNNKLDLSTLTPLAMSMGLAAPFTQVQFDACRASAAPKLHVDVDQAEAKKAGMSITPTIVLRNHNSEIVIPGAYYGKMTAAIDVLLGKQQ
jgi:protein-disulfide isomerase